MCRGCVWRWVYGDVSGRDGFGFSFFFVNGISVIS